MCRPLATLAALAAVVRGNYEQAIALHEERLGYARGAASQVARIQCRLGMLAGEQGQYDRATHLLQASYRCFAELDSSEGMGRALAGLAWIARTQGNPRLARRQFAESLVLFQKLGATWGIAECLAALARLAADGAQLDVATRLFASAARLRETQSIRPDLVAERAISTQAASLEQDLEAARAALKACRFEALWKAGPDLTVREAVRVVLAALPGSAEDKLVGPRCAESAARGGPAGLSRKGTGSENAMGMLRSRPHARLILGECFSGAAFYMLQANGSMMGLRANSPRDALARIMPIYLSDLAAPTHLSFYMRAFPSMTQTCRYRLWDPVHVGLPHPGHFRIPSVATHLKHTSYCGTVSPDPGGCSGQLGFRTPAVVCVWSRRKVRQLVFERPHIRPVAVGGAQHITGASADPATSAS